MAKPRSKQHARLLHELRVHLRLGPNRTEPDGPIDVVKRLYGLDRIRSLDAIPYENQAKLLMGRCIEAGISIDVVRRTITQCRYR